MESNTISYTASSSRLATRLKEKKVSSSSPSSPPTLPDLAAALSAFAQERDWAQFHAPKNLVMALTGEVGELAEIFQWMSERESFLTPDSADHGRAREELADVLLYTVRLASVLGIDLMAAAQDKLRLNAQKYPVDKAKGSSKKYTQL